MSADLFPDLPAEQAQLVFSRACRDRMIQRFAALDPQGAADEITKEYIEVTVAEALEDLGTPGAGDFFGRIVDEAHDRWYIGRRHIENDTHDPVVVDWRAPIAAPFYRATHADPFGLAHRRRFTVATTEHGPSELTAYLDEQLDDQPTDFPRINDAYAGLPNRYGYSGHSLGFVDGEPPFDGVTS